MHDYAEFVQKYPAYDRTHDLDELRERDYARLDRLGQIYLDYTGGGLYAESQVRAHQKVLAENVFGNPHSTNPTSQAATHLIESTRQSILEFFNADPAEYTVIFSLNASGALKLVGESYPFQPGSHYLLTFDNHNSVNGIREYAHAKGAEVTYVPVALPDMRVDTESLATSLEIGTAGKNNLFAYPAQSNFSAVLHPLEWIERAHALGWDVLLDAAAFAPTNPLDLSKYKADFVPLSFYKIFGYPTGIGALLARREVLKKLHRPWFAGGTITVASVQGDKYYLAEAPAAFEDGTLDYLNIPAVEIGLKHIRSIGLETIHERVGCWRVWRKCATARECRWHASMDRSIPPNAAARSRPISLTRTASRSTIASSRQRPTRPPSPCGPAASATPGRARSPWAFRESNWQPASPVPATISA